ncbi:MAG: tetratricopeptide repeat protein [Spirochaetaceae bacterium]|jgi:tetratricopeptide (TPR) repeat protein|nr:tetratricopeptide repeat protein [Spirochaetaceae bacterium]
MAKKGIAGSVIVLIILIAGFAGIFGYKKIAARHSLAAQIAALSPRGAPPQTIEDLRKAIALYETKIEEHLKDSEQTGIYWKILGSRLVDKKLYGEALEALERAAHYYPEDETVQYLIGISAGTLAKSEYFSPAEQENHFRIAEQAYLRAIDIDGRYGKALYGLSVLYVFEFNRPAEALPYLERFLDINVQDTDAMFVLAAARYMMEDYQGAVDLYDRILGIAKNAELRAQAENNKQQVMNAWYR